MGTKLVVTENLTKRRSEFLKKVRSIDNVQWTMDYRIVRLLDNGKKVAIQNKLVWKNLVSHIMVKIKFYQFFALFGLVLSLFITRWVPVQRAAVERDAIPYP